jgi:hypothetical protein
MMGVGVFDSAAFGNSATIRLNGYGDSLEDLVPASRHQASGHRARWRGRMPEKPLKRRIQCMT